MLTVICYLWHDAERRRSSSYTHDHVRTLKSMVARHLSLPHRFVCITDDTIDGVETEPLDWRTHVPGTCALKLMHWRPDIGALLGYRILCLDIDIVVTGGIDALVKRDSDVVLFRNPNYSDGGRRAFYQGSVQLLIAGSRSHVWANIFKPWAPQVVNHRFGGFEQAWLSEMLSWDEAHWDASDGIFGAGRLGDSQPGVQTELPKDARIVVFPGDRMMDDAKTREKHPWISEHWRP